MPVRSVRTPIHCYRSLAGVNKIESWIEDLSCQERADTRTFLEFMAKTEVWSLPSYRPRLAGLKGIGELRWFSVGKQHRLLGYFGDRCWYALAGCIHKQGVYIPHGVFETAKKRKQEIEQGAETSEYEF